MSSRTLMAVVALVLLTLAVFLPLSGAEFVNFDDDQYVYDNPVVTKGLTAGGVRWAFASVGYAANWHPLTWLSHMLDVSLFGLKPAWHHLHSLLLHAANAVLLFLFLAKAAGVFWPALVTAALFAVHPLHVESVAWVAERKDVLSTFFWMLAMVGYLRHVRRPGRWSILWAAVPMGLGLMAKAMLVTLPLVFLILDFWPLGRLDIRKMGTVPIRGTVPILIEKIPLVALAAGGAWLAYLAQAVGGGVWWIEQYSLPVRVQNVVITYARYVSKTLWPRPLAVFYPYDPAGPVLWKTVLAGMILIAVTVVLRRLARRFPPLLAGWLWYLVTLVPTLGLFQIGAQSMADRYTYVPLIGLFVSLAWGAALLVRDRRAPRTAALAAALLAVAAWGLAARRQVGYWHDSVALFSHAAEAVPGNWLAHANLGSVYFFRGDLPRAEAQYRLSLDIKPDYPLARYNLGAALQNQGKLYEAEKEFRKVAGLEHGLARGRAR